jgi:hypothetical protein
MKEPRPYTTRYPIADDRFHKLKQAAEKAKPPKTAMPASVDAPSRKVEAAGVSERTAQAAPDLEPAAAPTPATSFAAIPATGWIPPDCTLAVGPAHVLASVNPALPSTSAGRRSGSARSHSGSPTCAGLTISIQAR